MIFRNHYNMLICCSRNIYYYYQYLKHQFIKNINIFIESVIHLVFQDSLINNSKEQNLFEIESFCNTAKVLTVPLNQINSSLLNKYITILKYKYIKIKINTHSNILKSCVCTAILFMVIKFACLLNGLKGDWNVSFNWTKTDSSLD